MLNGSQAANRPIIAFPSPHSPLLSKTDNLRLQDKGPSLRNKLLSMWQRKQLPPHLTWQLAIECAAVICMHRKRDREREREKKRERERGLVSPALVVALNESWAGQKERLVEFVAAIQDAATAISMLR